MNQDDAALARLRRNLEFGQRAINDIDALILADSKQPEKQRDIIDRIHAIIERYRKELEAGGD